MNFGHWIWGLRNNAYTKINIRDDQSSQLNLKLIDFAPGLPETESTIEHAYEKSVGFDWERLRFKG